MSDPNDSLDAYIDAAAQALGLPLDDAWKPAVRANLKVTLDHARLVEDHQLGIERDGAGNADTGLLAAGELMRKARQQFLRQADAMGAILDPLT